MMAFIWIYVCVLARVTVKRITIGASFDWWVAIYLSILVTNRARPCDGGHLIKYSGGW